MSNQLGDYAVGVDIGGTNMIAAVIATKSAKVLSRASILTEAERGPDDGFYRLGNLIEQVSQDANVSVAQLIGIGVGCTGPIDPIRGRVNNPYTLPTWEDAPLIDYLVERFALSTVLLNDAQAAALGEFWAGAGRNTRHMIYITVGTGIGSGIIIDSRLHQGVGEAAGEVGHQVIDCNGPECYCGARGCLEMFAAAPAISRRAAEQATTDGILLELVAGNREQLTPKHVYEAAKLGDAVALMLLSEVGYYLGIGIGNLLNILAPEVVVLGGGVSQGWDLIAPSMLNTINSRKAMVPYHQIRIIRAELGLNAGVIGAVRQLLDTIEL